MIQKKKLMVLTLLLTFLLTSVISQTGYVVDSSDTAHDSIIYTWMDPDSTSYYQDSMGDNPDLAAAICGEGDDRHVGIVHAMDEENNEEWVLTSYESGNDFLPSADTQVTVGGNDDCYRTGIGGFVVSPSHFDGKTPEVHIAAHPSDVSILHAEDSSGSGGEVTDSSAMYEGSYSGSMSYEYPTNEIFFDLSTIQPQTDIGSESYSPDAGGRGISPERPVVAGICTDPEGRDCPAEVDTVEYPNNFFGHYFDISDDLTHNEINDQNTYTRYGVVNSIEASSVDIGTDLEINDLSVTNDPVFYSQEQEITFTVENTGNVPMTSGTTVEIIVENIERDEVDEVAETYLDLDGLEVGESIDYELDFDTKVLSGMHEVQVDADATNDIEELNPVSSEDSIEFELRPITLPEIYIDGEETTTFEEAGRPYNLSMVMQDSDNVTMPNATVKMREKAGVNTFVPAQSWNASPSEGEYERRGTTSVKEAEFKTDKDGIINITIMPTGNRLFAEQYEHLDAEEFLGEYTVEMAGHSYDGNPFIFLENGDFLNEKEFEVKNISSYDSQPPGGIDLPNFDEYLDLALNNVYQIFNRFRNWVS